MSDVISPQVAAKLLERDVMLACEQQGNVVHRLDIEIKILESDLMAAYREGRDVALLHESMRDACEQQRAAVKKQEELRKARIDAGVAVSGAGGGS